MYDSILITVKTWMSWHISKVSKRREKVIYSFAGFTFAAAAYCYVKNEDLLLEKWLNKTHFHPEKNRRLGWIVRFGVEQTFL